MHIQPLQAGQPELNLLALEKNQLTKYSPIAQVATAQALTLFKENASLAPRAFETFRAKSIACCVGSSLSLALGGLFGLGLYRLYQISSLTVFSITTRTLITAFATKALWVLTPPVATLAFCALACPPARTIVANTISSLFQSALSSLKESSLAHYALRLYKAAYSMWYDSYHFAQRKQSIRRNQERIICDLTTIYNEMGSAFNLAMQSQSCGKKISELKIRATLLKNRLPNIHAIFERQGISHQESIKITRQLEEALLLN